MARNHNPWIPNLFEISRKRRDTEDTFTLEMVPADHRTGIQYAPGQFNMLYVFGVGEVPISISGDPQDTSKLVHTTRAVGTVTKRMQHLKPGMFIGVRGPFGSSWPVKEAEGDDVVLIAGGIGLAPLRPALHSILARRSNYGKIVLLYGTRTPEDILFRKELENWRKRFDLDVFVTVDRATGKWHGDVGVVTQAIPKAPFDPYSATVMVCGPEIMMRYTVMALEKRGVSTDRIYASMERNMKCAIGFCGHCQFGPTFVCKDGPVYRYDHIDQLFTKREI